MLCEAGIPPQHVGQRRAAYGEQQQEVTVQAGETAAVEFRMESSALELDEMIVTGTAGGSQRRAIGNVVTSVNADQIIAQSPINSVDQLIGPRAGGTEVLLVAGETLTAFSLEGEPVWSLILPAPEGAVTGRPVEKAPRLS